MSAIITTLDQQTVAELKNELYQLMNQAKSIGAESKFETIREAQYALYQAKGLHRALSKLELIGEFAVTLEDIDRIERKQMGVLEEKRRTFNPWKQ